MSTQINVTVDRGGLLQRNRQQTTANRQASTEQEQRDRAVSEARQERERREQQERQRSGVQRPVFVPDEPAANLRLNKYVFFGPKYEPYIELEYSLDSLSEYRYYFLINTTKVKTASNTAAGLIAGRTYLRGYELINTGSGQVNRSSFELGAGPSGANALKLLSTRSPGMSVIDDGTYQEPIVGDESYFYGARLTFECFIKTEFGLDSDYASLDLWIDGFELRIDNDNSSRFRVFPSTGGPGITHGINVSANQLTDWTHVAVVLSNSTYRLYVSGTLVDEFSSVVPEAYFLIKELSIGTSTTDTGRTDALWFSSLRISKGVRYSGTSFTPPTSIT